MCEEELSRGASVWRCGGAGPRCEERERCDLAVMGAGWNDSGCGVCTEWWSDSTGPHEGDKRFCDGKMILSDHS